MQPAVKSMKNSNGAIGNRASDLPAHLTAPPHAPFTRLSTGNITDDLNIVRQQMDEICV